MKVPESGEFLKVLQTCVGNARVFQVETCDLVTMQLCESGERSVIERT